MKKVLITAVAALLVGCGGSNTDTNTTVTETNVTKETNTTTQLQDINITNKIDNNITNDIDNNVTVQVDVNITALSSGYYGDGTFINPFVMMNANYQVEKGEEWFMTPSLSTNCTIRVRTRVYITNISAESSELLPIPIKTVTSSVFEFDVNDSWATLSFAPHEDGYITMVGECLDTPKLYNLGE